MSAQSKPKRLDKHVHPGKGLFVNYSQGGGAGVYFFKEFIKKFAPLKFHVLKIAPPQKKSCEKNGPTLMIFSLVPGCAHSFTFLKRVLYINNSLFKNKDGNMELASTWAEKKDSAILKTSYRGLGSNLYLYIFHLKIICLMFRFLKFIKIFCFNTFNFFYFCPIFSLYSKLFTPISP